MIVVQIGDCTLVHGDCLAYLPTLAPGSVDCVLTDPPFGVGNFVQTTGRIMGRGESRGRSVDWNETPPPPDFFMEIRRIATERIVWGANFFNCFEDRGGAIVWVKCQKMPNFSKADIASCTHFQKTEIVEIPWTNFTVTHKAETDHPCERPVELYEWCIDYLPRCESFMDPYMGSASVGVACIRKGKRFVGVERDARYFDIACRRIEKAYADRANPLFGDVAPKAVQLELGDPMSKSSRFHDDVMRIATDATDETKETSENPGK